MQSEETSLIMPRLVELYEMQKIEALASDRNIEARSELVDVVSELLSMDLSVRESDLVADVLICLMRQVQKDLCLSLSEKLAKSDNVPLRLLMHVASDAIDIARPVLRNSPVFQDMDLIYIIKSKPAAYWREIALRSDLSDDVAMELLEKSDRETSLRLAANKQNQFAEPVLTGLGGFFAADQDGFSILLQRPEITSDLLQTLYQSCSDIVRQFIATQYEGFASEGEEILNAADLEFFDVYTKDQYGLQDSQSMSNIVFEEAETSEPTQPAVDISTTLSDQKVEGDSFVVQPSAFLSYLEKGLYREFFQAFSDYAQIPKKALKAFILDEKMLAVIAKAIRMDKRAFVSMNLLVGRMGAKGGHVNAHKLKRGVHYFDTIARDRAEAVLDKIRKG